MDDELSGEVTGAATVQGDLTVTPLGIAASVAGSGVVHGSASNQTQISRPGNTRRGLTTPALPRLN